MLASMKPVLLLEDLRDGKIDEDKYMDECGQRCINEMELAEPRPYETGGYIENALANYEDLGVNAHAMLAASEEEYKKAMAELQETDPAKARKAAKMVDKFAGAHRFREEIRSKGVWIFSILREFDELQVSVIYSEAFDTPQLGAAIMNRLIKAAGHQIILV